MKFSSSVAASVDESVLDEVEDESVDELELADPLGGGPGGGLPAPPGPPGPPGPLASAEDPLAEKVSLNNDFSSVA
jgi:hypothetical protein